MLIRPLTAQTSPAAIPPGKALVDKPLGIHDEVEIGAASNPLPLLFSKAPHPSAPTSPSEQTEAPVISAPQVSVSRPLNPESLRTARTLGVLTRRMQPHLSPMALHELHSNAELAGVLCGEMTMARLRVEGKAVDDLKAVVNCLALVSRERLATVDDPQHPGQLLVLNKSNINLEIPEVRWGCRRAGPPRPPRRPSA